MKKSSCSREDIRFLFIRKGYERDILQLYYQEKWIKPEEHVSIPDIRKVIEGSFAFLVAVDGSRAIGMARALSDGYSDAYIQDVVVCNAYQGCGIGKKLVSLLVEYLKKEGIDWIGLVAKPGTRQFYRKLNFEVLKDHYPMQLRKQ